jgi:4-amino-4-deoxy-L-arabinose transferase-like glycosyltransferase
MVMSRADRIALILSLIGVLVTYIVTMRIFEGVPHIEDEIAYVWQAQAATRGQLTVPSPPDPHSFLVPFVVDYDGRRFGKYPPGWPALLAIGIRLGLRDWLNPLLAGLGVWLTYRLGKRAFSEPVGLLAAGLSLTSPFFLMNSGTLLSHPFGLVLSAAFALAWLDAFGLIEIPKPALRSYSPWLPTVLAGLCLGLLALSRPLTAIGVGLPFALHGLYLLIRGDWAVRRRLIAVVVIAISLGALLFVWQYAVTGNPFLDPYTLWWPYDRVGFGPGIGRNPAGHNLHLAWVNTRFSLWVGWFDYFGWAQYSWIFLPFGGLAILPWHRKLQDINWSGLLVGSVFASLVVVYLAYWIGSSLLGPRYYYEGLYSLTILSAAGIAFLAGWPTRPGESWKFYNGWKKLRPLGVTAFLALLVSANLLFYTPLRLNGLYDLYGISRAQLAPFLRPEAQKLTPALVIVHVERWMPYGALLELEDPFLDTPFIFAVSRGTEPDQHIAQSYPDRTVIQYYPDDPYHFYLTSTPSP